MKTLASRIGVLCSALCGVVAAHALTYVAVFPGRDLRHDALEQTGHAYWPSAVLTTAALGVAIVGARIARELRGEAPRNSLWGTVVRLWWIQALLFVVLETVERAAVGAPVRDLFEGLLLPIGIAVQGFVAAAIAVGLRALARGAAALIRSLRRSPRPGLVRRPAAPLAVPAARRPLVLAGAQGTRGPPTS